MRKLIFVLICLLCFSQVVNANTVIFEDDLNETEFSDNDFWREFTTYSANENNFVFEGENGYFHGKWTEGASAIYVEELENYTLYTDIKTGGSPNKVSNCYKSAIVIRVMSEGDSFIFEPDNGDGDPTSFLGASGIYFYCFGNTLEVSVHTKMNGGTAGPVNAPDGIGSTAVIADASIRDFGVYSKSCYLTLPEGQTFDEFTKIKVIDKKDSISFYVDDKLMCELLLSNLGEIKTMVGEKHWDKDKIGQDIYVGESYKTVAVRDTSGNEVMKVEEAVVAPVGLIGFVNRANAFMIDNIKLELNYDNTPEPIVENTVTPIKTENVTLKPTENSGVDNGKPSNNVLTYVLIAAVVLIVVGAVFVLIKTSDKKKK